MVGRFETWSTAHGPFTGKVGALHRLCHNADAQPPAVKDIAGFAEAMHIFAIRHFLTVSGYTSNDYDSSMRRHTRLWMPQSGLASSTQVGS